MIYLIALLITITLHELGHLVAALYYKIPVEYIAIGFGKPRYEFKLFGLNIRLCFWLFGGEVKVKGESDDSKGGLRDRPYYQKLVCSLIGVAINLLIACIVYLILYHNIFTGICNDINFVKWMFWYKPDMSFIDVMINKPFLWSLAIFNSTAVAFNIIPLPPLDGSYSWTCLISSKVVKILNIIGFSLLIIFQIIYLIIFLKRGL